MQADLRGKMTIEIEMRSSGHLFHELFTSKPHQISNIAPSEVQGCKLHKGEFGKNGSIIAWSYTHDGKTSVAKEIIENLDMEKMTITFRVIEGDLLDYYNTFLLHLHVVPKVGNISVVKWTLEYEKLNKDVPDPTSLADFMTRVSKQVVNHLTT